ncbi:LIC_11026 family protein [Leptospira sp. 'Mane']|uniref:LIC_11026 family protein n=1 Tax=Leptospira sp. 'Mane' TaxID=3387407 RepID=UPI00398A83A9
MGSLIRETILRIAGKRWFRLLFVLFLFYKLIFNSFTADFVVPGIVSRFTESTLSCNFTTFSLFFGIEAESVELKTKGVFDGEVLFQTKRLALRYNLLSLLFLKLKISEVSIENGNLFLHERGGVWNFATLLKPSSAAKKPVEKESEPLDEIKTYLPLAAEAHIRLESFHAKILKESEKRFSGGISDFSFRLDLESNRFTSIPLSISLLDQIDSFYFALNPDRSLPVEWDSEDLKWKQTLPVSILLDWKRASDHPVFLSSMQIGSDDINFEYKNKPIHLGASLNHKIEYFPDKDQVQIEKFILKVMGDVWLSVKGEVNDTFQDKRSVNLSVGESRIQLTSLNRTISQLKGLVPDMTLGGELSLQETFVQGLWNSLSVFLNLQAKDVYFSKANAKAHKVPKANINLLANLNLASEKEATAANPIPILKDLDIKNFDLVYNGIKLVLGGSVKSEESVSLNAHLEDLNLSDFSNAVAGKTKADVKINAKDFANLPVHLDVVIDGFRYSLDRSRSPSSRLALNGDIVARFSKPFGISSVEASSVALNQKTLAYGKAAELNLSGNVVLGEEIHLVTNPLSLNLNLPNLLLTLPLVLKEKIAPLQNILGADPSIKAKLDVLLGSDFQKIKANLFAVLPGLEMKDLVISADVVIRKGKEKKISINQFQVSAFQKTLVIGLKGSLEEKPNVPNPPFGSYFASLDANIRLFSPEKKYLLKGTSFSGELALDAQVRDYDVNGSLVSTASGFTYTNNLCPGINCKMFLAENINSNIPFHHNLAWKKQDSLIVGDKSVFIKTYGRTPPPNLSISQIVGTHPYVADVPFVYVKNQPDAPGLSARIDYRENYATIEALKAYTLDGVVLGKNIIFNVGAGQAKDMEFRGNIQIRDIDLKQLMPPKTRDKIDDGKVKADLNLSGRDLTEPVANLDLFFSIFQIGSDFGKSALNVISTQNFLMDRITDSYSVNKIEVSLSKGLVYADVFFRRSLLSLFANLEDSKISQQRMPLANFLKRAQSEIQSYQ